MIQAIHDYLLLKRHQKRFSTSKIEALQWKSIQGMISYAKKKSPFYRTLYNNLPTKTWNDFYRLPIINKTIMMENFSSLNTCNLDKNDVMLYALNKEQDKDYLGYYQGQYVIGLSSGTSGNKGIFITPKAMTKRLPGVFLARGGLSIRDLPLRILFCLRVFSQGFDDINAPLMKLNYLSTMTPSEEIIDTLNKMNINILMAPPSLIRLLLPLKEKITVKLKKIITYAEVLSSSDKTQFQDIFKTKVIEIYQASEGQIASACTLGNLHINEDLVFVELYDKFGHLIKEPHVIGHKMFLTNLINTAQPLIRYEMNDMIVLDEPCPCGSHFRTIKKILGRTDDLIYALDQENKPQVIFPDLFARWIITTDDDIREFQVIQSVYGKVTILLDVPKDYNIRNLEKRLLYEFNMIGCTLQMDFEVKPLVQPSGHRKFKRFISNISL